MWTGESPRPHKPVARPPAAYDDGRMSCLVSHTSVDCRNAFELSEWWKALLDYADIDGDPNLPGHGECMIRDEEVERLVGLGTTVVADHRGIHGPGSGWVVLADPEGNELCVLRSQAELDATS